MPCARYCGRTCYRRAPFSHHAGRGKQCDPSWTRNEGGYLAAGSRYPHSTFRFRQWHGLARFAFRSQGNGATNHGGTLAIYWRAIFAESESFGRHEPDLFSAGILAMNEPNNRKRVYLVEDHPLMRASLAALLKQELDLVICGEADNAKRAQREIMEKKPDLAILDISLN